MCCTGILNICVVPEINTTETKLAFIPAEMGVGRWEMGEVTVVRILR